MHAGLVVSATDLCYHYRKTTALNGISLAIPRGQLCGFIGPDGVGKSTLLSLIAGARAVQRGQLQVLAQDITSRRSRKLLMRQIAYMPQGLGKNLYPTLSVLENLTFFAKLFAIPAKQRDERVKRLLTATDLWSFRHRPSGKLSGGMKQKLGLCCALVHNPDLLLLDEPTTGVDPLSRRQFWKLISEIRQQQPDISIIVATAYMEEAEQFDWLATINNGQLLTSGKPAQLLADTQTTSLEQAFMRLLGVTSQATPNPPQPRPEHDRAIAIEAQHLTLKFGAFTAVDDASFRINKGEIFGFLGSNGCGKTTTMKMLTGLLPPTSGSAALFGQPITHYDIETRKRVGYMTQTFSLYEELTVAQNLKLHGKLFGLSHEQLTERIEILAQQLDLSALMPQLAKQLPVGERQRLSLAVALIHEPDILILDEPTSGVDPVARDTFWRQLQVLARQHGVTLFISTHFMNEAERCDRISLMHAGKVLVTDTPAAITQASGKDSLEDAFVYYLAQAQPDTATPRVSSPTQRDEVVVQRRGFSLSRLLSISHRETIELMRDPVRLAMALIGSVILMFVLGYGINMDVDEIDFAVLDRDRTSVSRDYTLNLSGSPYFHQQDELTDYTELEQRLRSADISLAIEIPTNFASNLQRGNQVELGAWIDGSMPMRGETIQGYVQGMHAEWLNYQLSLQPSAPSNPGRISVESRYRYNPDIESLAAMVPAVIPLLLMLFPAILTSLSVVREKELGSITNFYVTPTRKSEFFLGKQLPYLALAMLNFFILLVQAIFVFDVELKGSLMALTLASLLYVVVATALGLIMSAFLNSQIAALFGTALATILPASQFSGMITPVTSLDGLARWIGEIYPTSYYMIASRGAFSKALGFGDLTVMLIGLAVAAVLFTMIGIMLVKKQER
ncbi:ribosome-associated ATPase/putative transporter RbbA [Idiomarina aquatica]|uniref:Multidrug ABC transporter ATP-binding protein n=1 Tax=Idiomarina aquatica TaxID=1327752 RepID=A0AA94EE05_9GAMM|nr:ribosome-associated ATPase/putative transporter RbbA [Idiomarina aquatica]RUO40269.1 multidrug ABC transporter ATP-binding protein [Idiomarina aquatica]